MTITLVKINKEDAKLFKRYCTPHKISLSKAFKHALLEKIEDKFDSKEFSKQIESFNKNPKTYSLDELRNANNL